MLLLNKIKEEIYGEEEKNIDNKRINQKKMERDKTRECEYVRYHFHL